MESNKVSSSSSKNRFADYFVICGLDYNSGLEPDTFAGDNLQSSPLERPYKCKVLGHYPENVPWNPFDKDAVGMLCLPHGLQFRTQKHSLDPRFHSFVITRQDGKRYYGASYVFFEEVRNRKISSAMQTLQAMHLTELSSGQQTTTRGKHTLDHNTRSLPRHFKLASHHTRIAQNYYDHTKDTLHVTKSIALILQHPFIHAAEAFLTGLYRCWKEQGAVSLESHIYNLLYEVTVPGPGRSLGFVCYPDRVTVVQRPSNIEELPLFDYSMREMFTLLGVDCVLQLFTCMLLENQVLLCSSEYQRLMLVAECMTALLFPFTWPHVYVPILPASLQHFLDAPVPFIMGLHSRENRINIPSEANLCYVDLDSHTIQLPEELPSFPHKAEFIAEISDILDRYKVPSNHDRIINTHADMSENSLMTTSCTLPRKHSWANELDEAPGPPVLSGPDALKRLVKLAKRTGVSLDGIDGPDWDINLNDSLQDSEEELDENQVIDEESYERELRFNNSIREIFLNRFVHIFVSYEHFVIQPNQDKEQWLSNRESMQNFDKATFLSDQPQQHLPFLSRFIETQMFATLVDNKILATWSKTEPNLRVFERRIKLLRKRHGGSGVGGEMVGWRPAGYERCNNINDSQRLLDKRLASVDTQVAPPREVLTNHASRNTRAGFPTLDSVLLNQEPSLRSRKRSSSVQWRAPRSGLSHSLSSVSLDELDAPAPRRTPSEAHPLGTNTLKPTPSKPPPTMSPALIAQTNWNFVDKLLKDCKAKTKRMLVEKMGTEAVQMGHSTQTSLVEENTLIASLCDLLERIWSHGLHNKQGKSALWSHLLNYQELEECNDTSKPIDPNFLTPDSTPVKASFQQKLICSIRSGSANIMDYLPFDLSSMALETTSPATSPSTGRSRSETRTSNTRRLSEESHAQPSLRPLPCSLTFDMRCVQAMTDIKTHIGYARAWVRLALEKKLLSRHLRALLSDTALLRSQYKRYAFLRCEEEKEQFLYHLLTLNAVDYHCFTNTYTNTRIPYRVAIFPSQKTNAGTTTANCWLTASGSLGETQRVPIPRGALEFVFHHKNLGILTTLRIAHDNSGLSPKWMVEYVIVRNEVTGHTYSFPCGRWLGRGIDDDSTERLLVGERVSEHSERGRGSSSSRVRSPSVPPPKRAMPVADIQTMLGDCLNSIVKFYHHPSSQEQVSTWTLLLCGETGLVACLEQVFLYGFKSVRLFGRNFYIWDFIAKVKEEKEAGGEASVDDVTRYYCDLVDKILSAGHSLGKDGRFQLFVCIGARDGMLADMLLGVMATSRTALDMFEEQSFLRDPSLLLYIGQILESLNQFHIVLENSLTQGIS